MTTDNAYQAAQPAREEIDGLREPALLNFGTNGCPICQSAAPLISAALAKHPTIRHIKVEDGSGRPLGRSFHVKLWPTLIFLKNGVEVERLVRPQAESEIGEALARLAGSS